MSTESMEQQGRQSRSINRRLGSWTTRLFALVLFAGLSLFMTYPLLLNLLEAVPGPPFDNFAWLYDLWWFRHTVVESAPSMMEHLAHNPTIFYPFGHDLRLSETMYANKALMAPLLFWGDEVVAYNVFLLLSFVLTGYTTYLLIAYLTDNPHAAMIGGAIFAFCPYRMHSMAAGGLPLLGTHWIPLIFLYLERTFRERKVRHALAAGFFMGLTVLSARRYLFIVGSMVLLFTLLRLRFWRKKKAITGPLSRHLALGGLVAVAMIAPIVLPVLLGRSGEMGWSLQEVKGWTASADDFFLPNVYHPIWGEFFLKSRVHAPHYPWYAPGAVYVGAVTLILALIGILGVSMDRDLIRAFVWMGVISLILGLGVVLRWRGEAVEIGVPPSVEGFFVRHISALMNQWALNRASYHEIAVSEGSIPVSLPALLLYLFLPLGDTLRFLYHFSVMVIFSLAVLAGMGAARILGGLRPLADLEEERSHKRYGLDMRQRSPGVVLTSILILGLTLFDFCSAPLPYGFTDVRSQPTDRWLAAQPDDVVVMQFPLPRALNGDALYRTQYHAKRVTYGYSSSYPPSYRYAMPVLKTFPDEECLSLLKDWGVTHVVVASEAYDAGWGDGEDQTWNMVRRQIDASPRLQFVGIILEEDLWHDEHISHVLEGNIPVRSVVYSKVYLYALR
ncbi:MAG: 6-pyruvoyl-tetrahydropterin synthase-related protein [Anaerolineales bacterium]